MELTLFCIALFLTSIINSKILIRTANKAPSIKTRKTPPRLSISKATAPPPSPPESFFYLIKYKFDVQF